MNRTIDPAYLLARVEMLEGQARLLRAMVAALVAAHPEPRRVAELMSVTWSDLQEELARPLPPGNDPATQDNWRNGAQSAWNALQQSLSGIGPPSG